MKFNLKLYYIILFSIFLYYTYSSWTASYSFLTYESVFLLNTVSMFLNFDFWVFHLLFTYLILWSICFLYLLYIKQRVR